MKNFFTHKMRKKSPLEIVGIIIFGGIIITGFIILFGFVLMWLWNWLMPEIFGLTTLTYWQAVGLFILFKILFGGFGNGGGNGHKKSSKSSKKESKSDFSKWEHYDKFWEEEGDALYNAYVERQTTPQINEPEAETSPTSETPPPTASNETTTNT